MTRDEAAKCLLWLQESGRLFRPADRDASYARLDMWAVSLEPFALSEARDAIDDIANTPGIQSPIAPAVLREAIYARRAAVARDAPRSPMLALPAGECERCDNTGVEVMPELRSRVCSHAPLSPEERAALAAAQPTAAAIAEVKCVVSGLVGRRLDCGGEPQLAGDVLSDRGRHA